MEAPPEGDPSFEEVRKEKFRPVAASKPDGFMLSVDASSYTLFSGNYWKVNVSRCAYVAVEVRGEKPVVVKEDCEDHIFSVVCPPRRRLRDLEQA